MRQRFSYLCRHAKCTGAAPHPNTTREWPETWSRANTGVALGQVSDCWLKRPIQSPDLNPIERAVERPRDGPSWMLHIQSDGAWEDLSGRIGWSAQIQTCEACRDLDPSVDIADGASTYLSIDILNFLSWIAEIYLLHEVWSCLKE